MRSSRVRQAGASRDDGRDAVVSTKTAPAEELTAEERRELEWAYRRLEHPSLAIWLSSMLGAPLEQSLALLPPPWQRRVRQTAERSIARTLDVAVRSLDARPSGGSAAPLHRAVVALSGAASGFVGPLGLLADLPLTTTLMLRQIAAIAREHGEDLGALEARLACMQVFALGGRTRADDAAETGYYGLRVAVGAHFPGAWHGHTVHLPYAIELVRQIAARFGVVVSQHAAVRLIPIAGALGGASLNVLFMRHFESVARGHFVVRRLERRHGAERVRLAYRQLAVARDAVASR